MEQAEHLQLSYRNLLVQIDLHYQKLRQSIMYLMLYYLVCLRFHQWMY